MIKIWPFNKIAEARAREEAEKKHQLDVFREGMRKLEEEERRMWTSRASNPPYQVSVQQHGYSGFVPEEGSYSGWMNPIAGTYGRFWGTPTADSYRARDWIE